MRHLKKDEDYGTVQSIAPDPKGVKYTQAGAFFDVEFKYISEEDGSITEVEMLDDETINLPPTELVDVLRGSVPAIKGYLELLKDEELEPLLALERLGATPRKGVITAIEYAIIDRIGDGISPE